MSTRNTFARSMKPTKLPKTITGRIASGSTVKEILADFPTLTEKDIQSVIAFAAASAEEDLPLPTVPAIA